MTIKKTLIILLILFFTTCFIGCGISAPASDVNAEINQEANFYPVTVTDALDREVAIKEEPQRLVSLSPAVTEIIFELNMESKLVGVSDYCNYPPGALTISKVGGFADPNLEVILDLKPDLVFASAGVQEGVLKKLEETGVAVVALDAKDLEGVIQNIKTAGSAVGAPAQAAKVVIALQKRIQDVEQRISQTTSKPEVFYEIWDNPLMTAGPGSFINDLIVKAGGRNIASNAQEEFPRFSLEVLLEKDPEVYIISTHGHKPTDVKQREGYQALSAVKKNKVFSLDENLITRPGPRVVDGLEKLAKFIHPEVF